MDAFLTLKWIHILSATILFGTGLGTAFHMWMAHRRGITAGIATASRNTVLADWLFTLPSGVIQVVTGLGLVWLGGHSFVDGWLVAAYHLYAVAGICWVAVVLIQLRLARIADAAHAAGEDLPERYHRLMRRWFFLGWPAFVSLIVIFWLMVNRPASLFGGVS